MRVTSMLPDIQYQLQQSSQNLSTALQQVSTGKRVNQLSDDPSASADMVRSLDGSANVDRYTSSGNTVLSSLQSADSALSSVVTSLTSALSLGTSGANSGLTSADRAGIGQQVQTLLSNVISQANTAFQGSYVFGGTASTTPPFVQASSSYISSAATLSPSTALTAGTATTISDAQTGQSFTFKAAAGDTVATLTQAVAGAVAAGTLSAGTSASISSAGTLTFASSSGIVVASNDPALGSVSASPGNTVPNAYAYVGNSGTNSVAIGDHLSVTSTLAGSQLFSSGGNVIQSLGALVNALQSGTTAQIATATEAINTAIDYVDDKRMPLGSSMNEISSQESYLSQENVTLTTQQSALVGISLAQAVTNMSQAELDNSAVLAAAAKVAPQTLLDYLK
jgi:flagellar hook-associated protein 3